MPELKCVKVPAKFAGPFQRAEELMKDYFSSLAQKPAEGHLVAGKQDRYILCFSANIGYELQREYRERFGRAARFLIYRFGYTLGSRDCHRFMETNGVDDAMMRLALGPVYFAYCGMANVEILEASHPSADDDFLLVYKHHNSFESHAFVENGELAEEPVCLINAGYSAGWCSVAFGIEVTAEELTCEAAGDESCLFVMAPSRLLVERISELTRRGGALEHIG
ncbi:MAG: hypothetical protein GF399_10880 [Candidatus Coatesbacteria bacterium]|nr:hypothetical protein [Candidatus Coatesbacteria bacterium]